MRSLLLLTCLMSLVGCASKPIAPVVNCPKPVEIPVTLSEPSFSRAQAYSSEVQNFLSEVLESIKSWRSTTTPSSE